jgi:hypothetical protein
MMDTPESSPLPWEMVEFPKYNSTYIRTQDGTIVCDVNDTIAADARLIVTAVNSHAELLAEAIASMGEIHRLRELNEELLVALKDAVRALHSYDHPSLIKKLNVIKKAEGTTS